jgi:hypothetical protein
MHSIVVILLTNGVKYYNQPKKCHLVVYRINFLSYGSHIYFTNACIIENRKRESTIECTYYVNGNMH